MGLSCPLIGQELEAYVSDSEDENGWAGSVVDMLSPEERERQRREREESRRVLSELKAVLGQRASEGERRKWKQLLFNDQGLAPPTHFAALCLCRSFSSLSLSFHVVV